jgi:hypothetical protein
MDAIPIKTNRKDAGGRRTMNRLVSRGPREEPEAAYTGSS